MNDFILGNSSDTVIDSITNAGSTVFGSIFEIFDYIISFFDSVTDALSTLIGMLNDVYLRIQAFSSGTGSAEFGNAPIIEAIGGIRYLIGDVAFYAMYLVILFGCFATLYKLVTLIWGYFKSLSTSLTGGLGISGLLKGIFK